MAKDVSSYLWLLAFATAGILTLIGVFRWLADSQNRSKKLNIVSYFAFSVFLVMLVFIIWNPVTKALVPWFGDSAVATTTLVDLSKVTIKGVILVLIVAFATLLILIVAMLVLYGLWALISAIRAFVKSDNDKFKEKLKKHAESLGILLNTPLIIVIIVGGIFTAFCFLPIIMGDGSGSLGECWRSGVFAISSYLNNEQELVFGKALSTYLLIYISVLGSGYAVANILFEILKKMLGKKNKKSFLEEYSNSIGLLAVGISLLLMVSSPNFNLDKECSLMELIIGFIKPFATVLFIFTLGVITLEIVNLIMDMRERMIRKESRYLFVVLVAQCVMILLKVLVLIYNSLSSAIMGDESRQEDMDSLTGVYERIKKQIAKDIDSEMSKEEMNEERKNGSYRPFEKKVTKK